MKCPTVGHRLRIGLGSLLLATGCNHYVARPDVSTVAAPSLTIPEAGTWEDTPAQRGQRGAHFDLPAVRTELVGLTSPYAPSPRTPSLTNSGSPGICVIETPGQAGGETKSGPAVTQSTSPTLPLMAGLHGPIAQLGFFDANHSSAEKPTVLPAVLVRAKTETPCLSCPAAPPPVTSITLDTPPLMPRGEAAPRRKSFVDITASPCFAHGADYRWLSGQVEHSHILGVWRLRFASVDEVDRYGGSVTLVENNHLSYLHDGEYVRVEGHLVDPEAKGTSPVYKIESFKVVERPNE